MDRLCLLLLAVTLAGCAASPASAQPADPDLDRGVALYEAGDLPGAAQAFEAAYGADPMRTHAPYSRAVLAYEMDDIEGAITWARRFFDASDGVPSDRRDGEWQRQRIDAAHLVLYTGAEQFGTEDYAGAQQTFEYAWDVVPGHRDVLYNLVLSHYKQDHWAILADLTPQLLALDPLNDNAWILLYNAHKGLEEAGDSSARERALDAITHSSELPIQLDTVILSSDMERSETTLIGQTTGGQAETGSRMRLAFTLVGLDGDVGEQVVEVVAPERGYRGSFEATIPHTAPPLSFRYRVLD